MNSKDPNFIAKIKELEQQFIVALAERNLSAGIASVSNYGTMLNLLFTDVQELFSLVRTMQSEREQDSLTSEQQSPANPSSIGMDYSQIKKGPLNRHTGNRDSVEGDS